MALRCLALAVLLWQSLWTMEKPVQKRRASTGSNISSSYEEGEYFSHGMTETPNIAYLNPIVQALFSLEDFRNDILAINLKKILSTNGRNIAIGHLQELFSALSKRDKKVIDTRSIAPKIVSKLYYSVSSKTNANIALFYHTFLRMVTQEWEASGASSDRLIKLMGDSYQNAIKTEYSFPAYSWQTVVSVPQQFSSFEDFVKEHVAGFMRISKKNAKTIIDDAPKYIVFDIATRATRPDGDAAQNLLATVFPMDFVLEECMGLKGGDRRELQALVIGVKDGPYRAYVRKGQQWMLFADTKISAVKREEIKQLLSKDVANTKNLALLFYSPRDSAAKSPRPPSPRRTSQSFSSASFSAPSLAQFETQLAPEKVAELKKIVAIVKSVNSMEGPQRIAGLPRVESFYLYITDVLPDTGQREKTLLTLLLARKICASAILGKVCGMRAIMADKTIWPVLEELLRKVDIHIFDSNVGRVDSFFEMYKLHAKRILLTHIASLQIAEAPKVYITVMNWSVQQVEAYVIQPPRQRSEVEQRFFRHAASNIMLIMLSEVKKGLSEGKGRNLFQKGLKFILSVHKFMPGIISPKITFAALAQLVEWKGNDKMVDYKQLEISLEDFLNKNSNDITLIEEMDKEKTLSINSDLMKKLKQAHAAYIKGPLLMSEKMNKMLENNASLDEIMNSEEIKWLN